MSTPLVVRYDGQRFTQQMTQILDRLTRRLDTAETRALVGPGWLEQLDERIRALHQRLERPFSLVVVGDFKRGKSTLINALLKTELVISDVAPETVIVAEVHHGPAVRATLHLSDGGQIALDQDDLPSERLTPILENLPSAPEHLRIEAPLRMLKELSLVDTPGMGDLMWRFDKQVQRYLPLADAVIYVVSALSPLSETERAFLNLSLRPQELSKVTFVVNALDTLRPRDAERVLDRIREQLQASFPDSPVFGLSALDELSRHTNEQPPNPKRADALGRAFQAFRDHLDEGLRLHRDLIRAERAIHSGSAILYSAGERIAQQRAALDVDNERLAEQLQALTDEDSSAHRDIRARIRSLRAEIGEMRAEAEDWMGAFIDRMRQEVLPTLGAVSHEDLQRHFPFFLSSRLRDGLTAITEHHQDRILDLVAERTTAPLGLRDLLPQGDAVENVATEAAFHTPAWTFIDHMHVVNMVLPGALGVLGRLVAGAADRNINAGERAAQYREALQEQFPSLRKQSQALIAEMYTELADAVCAALETRLGEELQQTRATLEQSLALHSGEQSSLEQARSHLGDIQGLLASAQDQLLRLRNDLQGARDGLTTR